MLWQLVHIAQVQIFPISVKSQHGSSAEADPGNRAGFLQTGGHRGTPEATGEQYRPAVGARRAPEFSLQGPIEIGALRCIEGKPEFFGLVTVQAWVGRNLFR